MPRGVPNAKKDDLGMRFTTFHAPLQANTKLTASSYLKYEAQSVWTRNAARANKNRISEELGVHEGRRGSKIIVIHPGSRWLRIGRAADVVPVAVPHVIARRVRNPPATPPAPQLFIKHPKKGKEPDGTPRDDDAEVGTTTEDSVETNIAPIVTALRDRMRFYKLRVVSNASKVALTFNGQLEGEESPNPDPPARSPPAQDVLVGEKVFDLPNDEYSIGYAVRWPIYAGRFNSRDYKSHQSVLGDIEEIWRTVLVERLGIDPKTFTEYSVVLVIPDVWDRFYVHELINMLLSTLGFRQIVCQQESLASTYGAGISNACVIDMGAVKTSVSCVDDGLVLADTRLSLSVGGDDVTEFLSVLLDRISFPYKELDLTRMHDWIVMEDLKCRICTLNEADVALNLYDFWVRRPGKSPMKYGLRAYDEVIIAPMILFDQRVVDAERKRDLLKQSGNPDISDELVEYIQDQVTNAMLISTQHLMPQPPPSTLAAPSVTASGAVTPQPLEGAPASRTNETKSEEAPVHNEGVKTEGKSDVIDVDIEMLDAEMKDKPDESSTKSPPAEQDRPPEPTDPPPQQEQGQPDGKQDITPTPNEPSASSTPAAADAIVTTNAATPTSSQPLAQPQVFPGGYPVDVPFEASKLPLDVAVYNSARAAGGDDRIRKYLQAVLVVGGGALTPGIVHALESRLQAIATPLVPHMEKVQIIPPPKDTDPRMLAWKGAAVLGKMDAVADLWVTAADWDLFGMRALKERCFYLQV
ncbi:actin-like ATPase domain-containing protein [Fomitiporia mediterranea MF3/22]|uniref:actin-like ATPase domain-containing protein n=1 Tax=Fomitiporia mediterranea (strain MF3/22) TaxID=694068 RepID=UPI0004408092|nr:actin-like ATPase domain-containing protein [Fomitiporia mediterranea MF3/22]EJD07297.1 actin-like ATPase domain-containing protein [Fomitiporia mediterranea MF3/22]